MKTMDKVDLQQVSGGSSLPHQLYPVQWQTSLTRWLSSGQVDGGDVLPLCSSSPEVGVAGGRMTVIPNGQPFYLAGVQGMASN